jgi:proline dehydrogenase
MITILNKLMLVIIPLLPISFIRLIAGRYVAGETSKDALRVVKELNDSGYSATVDILGEHVSTQQDVDLVVQNYSKLFDNIKTDKLDCNVSIKPTHIGLDLGESIFQKNTLKLLTKAKDTNNFLRIDMENTPFTDITIKMTKKCLAEYSNTGTVFQAYLYRTETDISEMPPESLNFRLCKGIYREDPSIAIQNRKEINANFLGIIKRVFANEGYVAIATHDLDLLKEIYDLIDYMKVPTDRFEFQVLYGVPMSGWLQKHLRKGYKVRVYVPFGPDWYAYSIRRLKENPNIITYIIKNFIRRS